MRPEGDERRGSKQRRDGAKALRRERARCVQEQLGGLCGRSRKGSDEVGQEGSYWGWAGVRAQEEFGLYFQVLGSHSGF